MQKKPAVVLAISGFDGSGGAGVIADAKAIHGNGGFAVASITAVTSQNSKEISYVETTSVRSLTTQLAAIFDDFEISAIKIGLLPHSDTVQTVASSLVDSRYSGPLVLDPILKSTSGTAFVDASTRTAIKEVLFPFATLITPNLVELLTLTDAANIQNEASSELSLEAETCATRLFEEYRCEVLVTGLPTKARSVVDLHVGSHGSTVLASKGPKLLDVHGTGCMLASSIATQLGNSTTISEAIDAGRSFVRRAMRNSVSLGHGQLLSLIQM